MVQELPATLSEDELTELDAFLLSDACDEDALSLDEAHGFLTAMIIGSCPSSEEDWTAFVWGRPRFPSPASQARMRTLLSRMYEDLASTLQGGRWFEPLAVEVEEEGEILVSHVGWCFGFMMAVDACPAVWDQLPPNEQGLLAPIAQLALLDNDEEPPMSDEEYASWVELLPGAVKGLYAFWRGRRR